jgi:hypothetical protein
MTRDYCLNLETGYKTFKKAISGKAEHSVHEAYILSVVIGVPNAMVIMTASDVQCAFRLGPCDPIGGDY